MEIEIFPAAVKEIIVSLNEELDTPYRPGGWKVGQLFIILQIAT
jgi:hypothetical protein